MLGRGFDGDTFGARRVFVEQPDCGTSCLGGSIAVASANAKAQVMWTANGPSALDVFSARVDFP